MLSLFPSLLSWSELSPLLIRLTLGVVFLYWAYKAIRATGITAWEKVFGFIDAAVGILLIIGMWTQGAALVAALQLLVCLVGKIRRKQFLTDGINYYLILLVLAVSLMITGAGLFAQDLPL